MKIFQRIKARVLLFLFRREVNTLAVVYVSLITHGLRTIDRVPKCIREQVKELLKDLEVPEELYTEKGEVPTAPEA